MILVSGATGNVGRELVRELLQAGQEVRALTRDPAHARLPAGVETLAAHATDSSSLPTALRGVQAAFVIVNMPTDTAQGRNWATALADSDVSRVVLISSLTLEDSAANDPVTAIHRENEAAIASTGIPWTSVRPGIFMCNTRSWIESVKSGAVVYGWPGDNPFAPVHEADIAAVAARALTVEGLTGQTLPVTGPETMTQSEQVAVLAEALGRSLRFEELTYDTAVGILAQMVGDGADSLLQAMAGGDAPWRRPVQTVEQVVGRAPLTWRQWCIEHADEFR